MIDSAGYATTVIGLQAVRNEQELYDGLVPQPRPIGKARGLSIRLAAAKALRRLADGLEANQRSAEPSRVRASRQHAPER